MDGLEEFEKSLATEKLERDQEERKNKKHRHHKHHEPRRDREKDGHLKDHNHSEKHHRSRQGDEERHRHKRRRQSPNENSDPRRHRSGEPRDTDHHDDLPLPDDEKSAKRDTVEKSALSRDAWMTTPSAIDIDYKHRKEKPAPLPTKPEPKRVLHDRELNRGVNELELSADTDSVEPDSAKEVDYVIGDAGSSWRMTKLRAVYTMAEETGKSIDEAALDKYGNMVDFDNAREEKDELERKKIYGQGYKIKEKPTGDLYRERMQNDKLRKVPELEQGVVIPDDAQAHDHIPPLPPLDLTALNRLRAQMMKAKLRKAPNAAVLEKEYELAAASFAAAPAESANIVLNAMHSRQLAGTRGEVKSVDNKRGRERGTVEANDDMTIEDMVREERRTRLQAGGESSRMAERIAKDGKFDDNLEYMNDNAEKLAKRVHKSEVNLKNTAVSEFQKLNRVLENCPLCHHEDTNKPPLAPVISLATRTYLTLPTLPEVSPGGAIIVPTAHRKNLLECDDDEWEELRNFMKSLTRMYHDQGQAVLFYENAVAPHRHLHAAMNVIPIPYDEGATAPAYFKEAFLTSDEEWSQHRKIIDTQAIADRGQGRMAFRNSIAQQMPYFHVWFNLDGGMGHVVEDQGRWPKGDLFAREIVGGIVGAEGWVVKKQGRWRREGGDEERIEKWKRGWRKFDWTRVLEEG